MYYLKNISGINCAKPYNITRYYELIPTEKFPILIIPPFK